MHNVIPLPYRLWHHFLSFLTYRLAVFDISYHRHLILASLTSLDFKNIPLFHLRHPFLSSLTSFFLTLISLHLLLDFTAYPPRLHCISSLTSLHLLLDFTSYPPWQLFFSSTQGFTKEHKLKGKFSQPYRTVLLDGSYKRSRKNIDAFVKFNWDGDSPR